MRKPKRHQRHGGPELTPEPTVRWREGKSRLKCNGFAGGATVSGTAAVTPETRVRRGFRRDVVAY
jgi:hypothetical protein